MPPHPWITARLHDARKIALFAGVYWGLAWLGFKTAPAFAHVTSIWFPTGVGLAVLLRYGIRLWPGALLGPVLFTLTLGVPLPLSILGGIGDLLSSVVGWWALTRLGFDQELRTFRDAVLLIAFGAWLPTLFGGAIGACSLILGGVAPPAMFLPIFKVWWLADMAGALTLAPLLLALSSRVPREDGPGTRREGALLLALLLATCFEVFGRGSQVFQGNLLTTYLILPFITWAAVRFGILATSAVVMVSSLAAILGCARTLAEADTHRSLQILNLQIFMSVMSGLGLMLSAALAERRRAEQALRENQRYLDGILDGSPALIYAKDATGRYLLANRRFRELFAGIRDTVVGFRDEDLFRPEETQGFRASDARVLATGQVVSTEERVLAPNGLRTFASLKSPLLDGAGRPEAICGVDIDITEQRNLEEQLRQAQKMEAIGQLAGGIAHDFNNILSVIGLYCTQALEDSRPDDPLRETIAGIQLAATKGTALTRQLLAFSRRQPADPREIELGQVIREMEPLLRRLIGSTIHLESRVGGGATTITADSGLLEQVVLNLAVNARDAMPQGGRITLDVRPETLDEASIQGQLGARPGPHVLLAITDTGCGMSPELKARIFEPFFTTKEPGKGTGLGLATVFGIVQQAGGHIRVDSEEGMGTSFRLYFPACQPAGMAGPER